ncbi:hypothetical protein RFI_07787 [Reticulomyxa filosa]|uniref:Uncharacterized protein n=1 Tax=Reticulomyxa filosa TaxID=46433 RepID=X6NVM8_RETFI|nr:hypothetical protein RFI_07787 [Reticulomyxa filosa]|eukprot:ETO29337.1 hypothetical protein RFI_07787 [Reticulomyxa filosa]
MLVMDDTQIKPDIFVVNEDGDRPAKREIVEKRGIEYKVCKRIPAEHLNARSSTEIKATLYSNDQTQKGDQSACNSATGKKHEESEDKDMLFPWRVCLIGGWLDQPWVSRLHPGCVVTINVKPKKVFKERSGLGTSTRKVGIQLWGKQGPPKELSPQQAAKYNIK